MFQAQVWKFAKTLKQHRRYSTEKGVFKVFSKFTGKHQRWSLFFNCNFIKKTPMQVFSYEFCEICKDTFFTEHLWLTTSEKMNLYTGTSFGKYELV